MRRSFDQRVLLLLLGCISGFILATVLQRRDGTSNSFIPVESLRKETSRLHRDALFENVRILCWIMTTKRFYTKAAFPMKTWARHCNKLIFVSDSEGDGKLPIFNAKVKDSSGKGLWYKVQAAFKHVHKTYRGQYDWVLKADEDTFVHLNNLRIFLQGYNSKLPIFFGERWFYPHYRSPSFMLGGAGYVLSTEAVDLLVKILQDPRSDATIGCRRNVSTTEEEPMLAECMYPKVYMGDTRDQNGLNTFHQNPILEVLFDPKFKVKWEKHYRELQYWFSMTNHRRMCCTNFPNSFHYLPSKSLFKLEFLIGHVNPFDVGLLTKTKT